MTIVPEATIAAHEQADRILCEFCYPDAANVIVEPFNDELYKGGLKVTIKRLVQSGLGLACQRWDHFRISGDGDVVFRDHRNITLVPVVG